jgi:uncharacterized protein (TIGR04255 family)
MITTTLGRWRNPPLAYVVAELAISPYYSIGAAMPGLQDALRTAYPRTIEGQEILFDPTGPAAPQPQQVWRLLSADQYRGVQIGARAISLHVTSYRDSTEFLDLWAEVLSGVAKANLGLFVERAGLRYVDLIVPADGRVPSDYLASGPRGLPLPTGAALKNAMWQAAFAIDGFMVNARTAAPTPEGLLLPPNFNALPLRKPAVMEVAEQKMMRDHKAVGFIDVDCISEVKEVFDRSRLVDLFTSMQKLTSRTFKSLLSSAALEEWK